MYIGLLKSAKGAARTTTIAASILPILLSISSIVLQAQSEQLPMVEAVAKGPNQINLTWSGVSGSIYGYLVEVQSDDDARFLSWTEVRPVPKASGYTCDQTILINGGPCRISDPQGTHVYEPPNNGVPSWVTEANYADPQDGSSAQFILAGLQQETSYSFRVRTYSGTSSPVRYGAYSDPAIATTLSYPTYYVSPTGSDSNDGSGPDDDHAWKTLSHSSSLLNCGQLLIVMAGLYQDDTMSFNRSCSPDAKIVLQVNPGDAATIVTPSKIESALVIFGSYVVIDGLEIQSHSPYDVSGYEVQVYGHHNALLNLHVHPLAVPSLRSGIIITGDHNLVYGSYLHDYGSPDARQNPSGNSGFVLTVYSFKATDNVIWSNHLTRGGHDVSLCKDGCAYNKWLNNIHDGGWGMALNTIAFGDYNLMEGGIIKSTGQLVPFYKPGIELSGSGNTVRRTVMLNAKYWALEVSAFGSPATDNLVYNNVFYAPFGCLFQASVGDTGSYDNNVVANTICYKLSALAMDIYHGNTTNMISNNTMVFADARGTVRTDQPIIIWSHLSGPPFEYEKPLAFADANYHPPFADNVTVSTDPKFVDEPHFDFHLTPASPLIGRAINITDSLYGTIGASEVGAFGLRQPITTPMERPKMKRTQMERPQ